MKRWLLIPLGAVAVVLVWLAVDPERREAAMRVARWRLGR